jgi:hypothetical protein
MNDRESYNSLQTPYILRQSLVLPCGMIFAAAGYVQVVFVQQARAASLIESSF